MSYNNELKELNLFAMKKRKTDMTLASKNPLGLSL